MEKSGLNPLKGASLEIQNNPAPQFIHFDEMQTARYFKLEVMEGTEGGTPIIDPNEIGILTH